MSEELEIERKYLVNDLPETVPLRPVRLRQGYLATDEREVRLRTDGERCWLTCKRGDGLVREEGEVAITLEQFEALWPLTEGLRIEKTRYLMRRDGHVIEIDVYHGSLEGLMVAEVEFDSEAASREFEIPDFFGAEVTDDPRYKNGQLARDGRPS